MRKYHCCIKNRVSILDDRCLWLSGAHEKFEFKGIRRVTVSNRHYGRIAVFSGWDDRLLASLGLPFRVFLRIAVDHPVPREI